jgi:hypothetical protein
MRRNRNNPASGGTLGGAGRDNLGGGLPSRSERPTRKVKYFGRNDNAARAAARMVAAAFNEPECQRLRLFTVPDGRDDLLPAGLSAAEVCFDRSQIDDAVRWTTGCLTAGWILFRRECRS